MVAASFHSDSRQRLEKKSIIGNGGKSDLIMTYDKTAATLFGLALFLAMSVNEAYADILRPNDPITTALGGQLYAKHCAECHGAKLEGQPNWQERQSNGRLPAPPHDASGHTWHHADAVLITLTKDGPATMAGGDYESDMTGYKDILSDNEIIAVLSYIKSIWPAEIRKTHDRINARHR